MYLPSIEGYEGIIVILKKTKINFFLFKLEVQVLNKIE